MIKMVRMKPHLVERYRKFGEIPNYFTGSGAMNYLFDAPFRVKPSTTWGIYKTIEQDRPGWHINENDTIEVAQKIDNREVVEYV